MNDAAYEDDASRDDWWLATLGDTLIWARMRVREAGTAEVLDSDGNTLPYDSPDTARAALMDAGFVAYDGLDEDDALHRGFSLHEVFPPSTEAGDLCAQMIRSLGRRT